MGALSKAQDLQAIQNLELANERLRKELANARAKIADLRKELLTISRVAEHWGKALDKR